MSFPRGLGGELFWRRGIGLVLWEWVHDFLAEAAEVITWIGECVFAGGMGRGERHCTKCSDYSLGEVGMRIYGSKIIILFAGKGTVNSP